MVRYTGDALQETEPIAYEGLWLTVNRCVPAGSVPHLDRECRPGPWLDMYFGRMAIAPNQRRFGHAGIGQGCHIRAKLRHVQPVGWHMPHKSCFRNEVRQRRGPRRHAVNSFVAFVPKHGKHPLEFARVPERLIVFRTVRPRNRYRVGAKRLQPEDADCRVFRARVSHRYKSYK